jgi:hypothetical protein
MAALDESEERHEAQLARTLQHRDCETAGDGRFLHADSGAGECSA